MPRLALVGDEHDGDHDYLDSDLWWAAESQTDYGAPIKALCKGNIGFVNLSGNTPNGYEIDSIDSIYDGKNHNNLPVFSGLKTLSPNGVISNFLLTDPVGYQNAFLESGADNVLIKNFYLKPSASPSSHMYAMYLYSASVNRVVRNCVIDARNIGQSTLIRTGYNRPFNVSNYVIFGGGVNCAGSAGIQNYINGLSYNSTTSNYDATTEKTNAASEDNTGSVGWTGYNGGELVDPENEDFRTKKDSPLADDGNGNGGFIGAFLEKSSTPNESYNFSAIINQQIKFSGTTNKTGNANALIAQNYQANSLTTKTINYAINQKQVVSLNSNTIKSANLNSVIAQHYQKTATANKQNNATGAITQTVLLMGYFNNSTIETHQFSANITINPNISAALTKQNTLGGDVKQTQALAATATKTATLQSNCFYQVTLSGQSTKQTNISGLINQTVQLNALFINTAAPIHLRLFRIDGQIAFQRFNGAIAKQRFNGALT
ncbi:hypothetical protein FGD67_06210 [Colwellia sp. M166]|uniref:hypothetical protein n=1 Tax=Colwellia sp. M166 TaxID=2583805 RepID=UPI00211E7DA0|nr:hypothetical protein [Colwellia sp. M166]UUO22824.1 hypothetical protein FGD67_06210 [Colwellia sp. M166]